MIEKEIEISPKFLPYYKEKISSSGTLVLFPFNYLGKFFGMICLDHPDAQAISQEKIVKAEKLVRNYEIFFNFSSQLFEYQLKHKLEKSYAKIANKFNTSLSSDELWDVAHEFLTNYFKFDRALLILTDSPTPVEESNIIIHRIFGTGSGFSEGDEYLLNDGVVAWCILQKQSIKFNDVYKRNKKLYRFTPDEPNHLATRSIVISPLVSENFTYGAIVLESQFPYQYGETEKELLNFLSQQLSHALRRIILFEKMAMYQAKDPELEVWNSKAFKERLEEEILRSQRFQHPFSVILFNVRFASGTNDFMDMDQKKILKEIIKIIKSESRKIDWIGTIQGNDISILLLETDQEGAKIYIQRILNHLRQASKTEIFANIRIIISVSHSSFPVMAKSSEEIFNQLKRTENFEGNQSIILEMNE
jgi:diguanylate cyclase (GGDEF)-like protein